MPTFDTPDPISATIDLSAGSVRVSAGDSAATVVDVRPSDAASPDDVSAAEKTRVEYDDGRLLVKVSKRSWKPRSAGGAVDVTIELPAGSDLHAAGGLADFRCHGRLGRCQIKTGLGHIHLDHADTPRLKGGIGDISLDRAAGRAEVTARSGAVRVGELAGTAVIKNSNGDTWVGAAEGDLRVSAANGSVDVGAARGSLVAKSANGNVRVGEAVRGTFVLETRIGDIEIGIPEGTLAWLDLRAAAGTVDNPLAAAQVPEPAAQAVEVRARTSAGTIAIRRP